ncbi:MAG TPA: hypothetical protein VF746_27355 [Longimicrobium sp.]|jgi:hypothetical protein
MQPRKLRLDDLQVESFHVLPEAPGQRGTVAAQEAATATLEAPYTCYDPTCRRQYTCYVSCGGSCVSCTCENTCEGRFTCDFACEETGGITCDLSCDGLCSLDLDACPLTA